MKPLYAFCKYLFPPFFFVFAPTVSLGKKRKYFANKKPLILIGNHLANIDTVVCALKHKRQIYFLGKKELTQNKLSGAVLRALGIIPVDRGKADIAAMRAVLNRLKEGSDVAIYPEGTRNKVDSRLCRVLGGAAYFAIKSKTAIVPFAFNLPARFGRKNYMMFGDPFELDDFYDCRLDNETSAKADEVVKDRLVRVKRLVDYFATLKGKTKKRLKKRLNDPKISFDDIYKDCEPFLLNYDISVAPDDFDQTIRPERKSRKAHKRAKSET